MLYSPTIFSILEVLFITVPVLLCVAYVTIAERKTLASMQRRLGPNIVGYWGLLQAFADALKLLLKEYISPTQANLILFFIGPIITLIFSLLGLVFASFFLVSTSNIVSIFLFNYESSLNTDFLYIIPSVALKLKLKLIVCVKCTPAENNKVLDYSSWDYNKVWQQLNEVFWSNNFSGLYIKPLSSFSYSPFFYNKVNSLTGALEQVRENLFIHNPHAYNFFLDVVSPYLHVPIAYLMPLVGLGALAITPLLNTSFDNIYRGLNYMYMGLNHSFSSLRNNLNNLIVFMVDDSSSEFINSNSDSIPESEVQALGPIVDPPWYSLYIPHSPVFVTESEWEYYSSPETASESDFDYNPNEFEYSENTGSSDFSYYPFYSPINSEESEWEFSSIIIDEREVQGLDDTIPLTPPSSPTPGVGLHVPFQDSDSDYNPSSSSNESSSSSEYYYPSDNESGYDGDSEGSTSSEDSSPSDNESGYDGEGKGSSKKRTYESEGDSARKRIKL